jgi:hypothetical protein
MENKKDMASQTPPEDVLKKAVMEVLENETSKRSEFLPELFQWVGYIIT